MMCIVVGFVSEGQILAYSYELYVLLCVFYGVLCDCVWLCIASGLDVFCVCLGLYCVLRVWVGVCF